MKAARFYGKGDVKVEDTDEPISKDGEVLIEITWCGICGSDLHEYIIGTSMSTLPISRRLMQIQDR